MEIADEAIRELLANEVLRPAVLDRALDLAVAALQPKDRARERRERNAPAAKRLRALERELANLADVAASGGAVPAVLDRLFTMVIPGLQAGSTSPTGVVPEWTRPVPGEVPAGSGSGKAAEDEPRRK